MKKILSIILSFCMILPCVILTSCEDNPSDSTETSSLEIIALSCGKADAFVLFTDNKTIVIDCGEVNDGKKIVKLLEQKGRDTIDLMILSHYDQDHIGGARKVFSKLKVDKLYDTFIPKSGNEIYEDFLNAVSTFKVNAIQVLSKISLNIDGLELNIYPPEKKDYEIDESNNSSLCVTIRYGEKSFMFTGDAQDERLSEITAKNLGAFDFLKFPYHGNYQNNLEAFLDGVQPKMSVITCSDKNPASQEALNLLSKYNTETYLTQNGDVIIKSDGKTITAEQSVIEQ